MNDDDVGESGLILAQLIEDNARLTAAADEAWAKRRLYYHERNERLSAEHATISAELVNANWRLDVLSEENSRLRARVAELESAIESIVKGCD